MILHFNLVAKFRHQIIELKLKGRSNHIWTLNIHTELASSCLEMDFSYFSERNLLHDDYLMLWITSEPQLADCPAMSIDQVTNY